MLSRRCVIMRLVDFSYERYQKALRQSAGAVVIILPKNMSTMPQDIVQVISIIMPYEWVYNCTANNPGIQIKRQGPVFP